jgi:hypothetical protein
MSTPSYAAFVRRHEEARKEIHPDAERIADAAPDWMDVMARGLTDAVSAPLRLNRPAAAEFTSEEPL